MHDLGVLVEKQVFPQKLAQALDQAEQNKQDILQVEQEIFQADHQDFGSALVCKWKFPNLFRLSTGYHHQPFKASKQYLEVTATIHLADTLAHRKQIGLCFENTNLAPDVLDVLELTDQQIDDILEAFDEKFEAAENVMK